MVAVNSRRLVNCCFFVLFYTVCLLQEIGTSYIASAATQIEKQFQITSLKSGFMVSAAEISYILFALLISYLGGMGNRGLWISVGCLLIATADILIGASAFLFPVKTVRLNSTYTENNLEIGSERPIKNELAESSINFTTLTRPLNTTPDGYLHEANNAEAAEITNIRNLISAPFAFCNASVNALRTQAENTRCSKNPSNIGPSLLIFGGQLIIGVGRTMPFSLGLPLIDDKVERKNLPFYTGGLLFIRILGPVLAFLVGSVTNKFYYSFDAVPGLSPRDPLWIGRWWAGFLGIGLTLLFFSLAFLIFSLLDGKKDSLADDQNTHNESIKIPKKIEYERARLHNGKVFETKSLLQSRGSSVGNAGHHLEAKAFCADAKNLKKTGENGGGVQLFTDFISTVKNVISNPVYMGALTGCAFDMLAFKGFFFLTLPKYLVVQFGLPQHLGYFYTGIIAIPSLLAGLLIAGAAMRKFKLQGRQAAALIAVCSGMVVLLSLINSRVGCKSVLSSIGDYSMINNGYFNNSCNTECGCERVPLHPVCSSAGVPFYSPCQAGCLPNDALITDSSRKIFYNCKCSNTTDKKVSRDFCDETDCKRKSILYFILLAATGVFGGIGVVPAILIILRSVPKDERSVCLGFQGLLVTLFATLPSPMIWGWIVDRTCILWNKVGENMVKGACILYDSEQLRLRTHITYGIMGLVSLASDVWVFHFAKNLMLTDEEPAKSEQKATPKNQQKMQSKSSEE